MIAAPSCHACGLPIPPEDWNRTEPLPCTRCETAVQAWVFPAAWTDPNGRIPTPLSNLASASCFHHPSNQADLACTLCGRFVCSVCATGTADHAVCNLCFDRGSAQNDPRFQRRATLHDGIGLALALLPLPMLVLTLITGPLAFVYTLVTWRRTKTAIPRGASRRWLALACSLLGLLFWFGLFLWIGWLGASR